MANNGVTYKEMVEFFDPRLTRLENKIDKVQSQINNQRLVAAAIGGFTGIIAAIINPFKSE